MADLTRIKFRHFNTQAAFDAKLNAGEILNTDICFIKETSKIYTHGKMYNSSEAGSIDLDTAMSDTSENGVQNKVIKTYVDESMENYIPLSRDFNNDFNNDFAI